MLTPVPDLIYGALAEIRVARGGDVVRAEDQALCLGFLNEILERLAVTPNALYAWASSLFLLRPGLVNPTIGPTGTFVWPRRPVAIREARILLADGTTTQGLTKQSAEWWFTRAVRPSARPSAFYYKPDWPNGELMLDPIPNAADPIILAMGLEIVGVAITDAIDLPPGYSELLRLWTAKKAAPSFAREFSAASQAALTECLGDVFGTNIGRVNDLDTRDGGVPGGRGGVYDYRTGLVS